MKFSLNLYHVVLYHFGMFVWHNTPAYFSSINITFPSLNNMLTWRGVTSIRRSKSALLKSDVEIIFFVMFKYVCRVSNRVVENM